MKKAIICLSATAVALMFAGCVMPSGPVGGLCGSIYTDASGPVTATSNAGSSKKGEATQQGILGFVNGDSSIRTAAANGGITKISHLDYHTTHGLGLYGKTTVTVYGE